MNKKLLIIFLVSLMTVGIILLVNKTLQGQTTCRIRDGSVSVDTTGCEIADVEGPNNLRSHVHHDYYPPNCVEEMDVVWNRIEFTPLECMENRIIVYSPMFLDYADRQDQDNEDTYFDSHCFNVACGTVTFLCNCTTNDGRDGRTGPYHWNTGGFPENSGVWCDYPMN